MKKFKRRKCMIWTRVSTQDQIENGSLDTQYLICKRYAEQHGFEIIERESAQESAKQENRHFKNMMKKVLDKRNNFDALIVLYASRFSRFLPTASNKLEEMKKKGVHLHIVNRDLTSESESDVMTMYNEFLKANQENYERKEITITSRLSKLKQGIAVSKAPKGYIRNPSKPKLDSNNELLSQLELCPHTAKFIKKAFKMVLQKKRMTEIVEELESLGFKTNLKRLGEILRNQFYAGRIIDKTLSDAGIKMVMGKHPKIVTPTEFDKVQRILIGRSTKTRTKTDPNLIPLKGIVKCPHCKEKMTAYQQKGIGYYKCNRGCTYNISNKPIESGIMEVLKSISMGKSVSDKLNDIVFKKYTERFSDKLLEQKNSEQTVKTLKNRLQNLIMKNLDGLIADEYYEEIKRKTESELVFVQTSLKEDSEVPDFKMVLEKANSLLHHPQNFYNQLPAEQRERFLKVIFNSGVVFNKEEQIFNEIEINQIFERVEKNSVFKLAS